MLNKQRRFLSKRRTSSAKEDMVEIEEIFAKVHATEYALYSHQSEISKSIENIRLALGRIENRQLAQMDLGTTHDNEFKVFSQWGEDGIIQYLLRYVPVKNKRFIEFGVEDYTESNTRFLLINNNWSGLVFDSDEQNIEKIKNSELYWRYDLTAKRAFINKDNIDRLIEEAGFEGEIGLLSIDIDGNDYWVWEAINVVTPAIVIVEYNSRFGHNQSVTIPYDKNFKRQKAHYSMLYAGASLPALWHLAHQKGYFFVGTNSSGNNAFFVHNSYKTAPLKALSAKEGFVAGKFREARDKTGKLSYISTQQEQELLSNLPLVEIPGEPSNVTKKRGNLRNARSK